MRGHHLRRGQRLAVSADHASVTPSLIQPSRREKRRVACRAVVLKTFPPHCHSGIWPSSPWVGELRAALDGCKKANMPRIDDLSDAEFMKLEAEYGDSLPICPICTLEDVRYLLLSCGR